MIGKRSLLWQKISIQECSRFLHQYNFITDLSYSPKPMALLLPTVDKWASIFHFEALFPLAICQVPFHAPFEDCPMNRAPGKTS